MLIIERSEVRQTHEKIDDNMSEKPRHEPTETEPSNTKHTNLLLINTKTATLELY